MPKPVVVIDTYVTMDLEAMGLFLCDRRAHDGEREGALTVS